MTDGIAVALVVLVLVVSVWAWRRYGRVGVAVVAVVLGGLVALLTRRRRVPSSVAPVDSEAERQARQAIAEDLRAGQRAIASAEAAREAAERIAADVDTAGDAEALTAHLVARSKGER